MKPITLHVVPSRSLPGQLSLRYKPDDATATSLYAALTESGAKPGDVVELRDPPAKFCPHCGIHIEEGAS